MDDNTELLKTVRNWPLLTDWFRRTGIRLRLNGGKENLSGGEFNYKEDGTSNQCSVHKQFHGKEITGGQNIQMAFDELMPS